MRRRYFASAAGSVCEVAVAVDLAAAIDAVDAAVAAEIFGLAGRMKRMLRALPVSATAAATDRSRPRPRLRTATDRPRPSDRSWSPVRVISRQRRMARAGELAFFAIGKRRKLPSHDAAQVFEGVHVGPGALGASVRKRAPETGEGVSCGSVGALRVLGSYPIADGPAIASGSRR